MLHLFFSCHCKEIISVYQHLIITFI